MPFSTWLSNKKGVEIGLPICVHFHVIRCNLRADPTEKLEAIDALVPPTLKRGEFRMPDKLIALLHGD